MLTKLDSGYWIIDGGPLMALDASQHSMRDVGPEPWRLTTADPDVISNCWLQRNGLHLASFETRADAVRAATAALAVDPPAVRDPLMAVSRQADGSYVTRGGDLRIVRDGTGWSLQARSPRCTARYEVQAGTELERGGSLPLARWAAAGIVRRLGL